MKKILIIEDEQELAELLKLRLERNGYEVMYALGGQEALRTTKRTRPDLILLDIVMPDIDGYQVAQRLRQEDQTKDTYIIFMTCKELNPDGVIKRCQEFGSCGYFNKLSDSEELLNKIKAVLG